MSEASPAVAALQPGPATTLVPEILLEAAGEEWGEGGEGDDWAARNKVMLGQYNQ